MHQALKFRGIINFSPYYNLIIGLIKAKLGGRLAPRPARSCILSPTWTKWRPKIIRVYVRFDSVRSKGVRGEKAQTRLRRTQILARSWQLLRYAGFLRAGTHWKLHDSSVKFDWLATGSFRPAFRVDASKISLLKGGRLVLTMAKSSW